MIVEIGNYAYVVPFIKNETMFFLRTVDPEEFAVMETHLKKAASNTIAKLSKRKAISIRLLESDIERLKAMALNEGMPYQTYITHIVHKITTGRA